MIVETVDVEPEAILGLVARLPDTSRPAVLDSCRSHSDVEPAWLIAAWDPFEVLNISDDEDPLATVAERAERFSLPPNETGAPSGAAIGSLSYDLGRRYEALPSSSGIDAPSPVASIALYDTLIAHDYRSGATFVVSTGLPGSGDDARARLRAQEARQALERATPMPSTSHASAAPGSNFDLESYASAVGRAQEYIAAGDIYQVNLTQRFAATLGDLAPIEIFARLRQNNPAEFAAYLAEPGRSVVSASPERFLRVRDRDVEMWPIKGTRPRGTTEIEDVRLATELETSAKDRAENVMIVDLVRNDLGRVAEFGSVHANSLCELQALPTVFHLVSKVSGRLAPGRSTCDAVRAAFPCGSITGAPKIRAMEIIEELEPVRRGLSMGAIGYVGFNGVSDWSVAIRTMEISGGIARFNVGGGIVADSVPGAEYEESLWKARALLDALGHPS